MGSTETQAAVAKLIAAEMEDGSVLAPHVAAAIAENVMTELLKGSYLIIDGRVHEVRLFDSELGVGGEPVAWYVQPVLVEIAEEESNGTEGS